MSRKGGLPPSMKSMASTMKDFPVFDAPYMTFRPGPKVTVAGGFCGPKKPRNRKRMPGVAAVMLFAPQAPLDLLEFLDPLVKEAAHDTLELFVSEAAEGFDKPGGSILQGQQIARR